MKLYIFMNESSDSQILLKIEYVKKRLSKLQIWRGDKICHTSTAE